ncbi:MAG: hypothetical protein WDZ59_13125 [Pirellulales bacterium]
MPSFEQWTRRYIELPLRRRLENRLRGLNTETCNGYTVVSGALASFYELQLLITAISAVLREAQGECTHRVMIDIHIGDETKPFRSLCTNEGRGDRGSPHHANREKPKSRPKLKRTANDADRTKAVKWAVAS